MSASDSIDPFAVEDDNNPFNEDDETMSILTDEDDLPSNQEAIEELLSVPNPMMPVHKRFGYPDYRDEASRKAYLAIRNAGKSALFVEDVKMHRPWAEVGDKARRQDLIEIVQRAIFDDTGYQATPFQSLALCIALCRSKRKAVHRKRNGKLATRGQLDKIKPRGRPVIHGRCSKKAKEARRLAGKSAAGYPQNKAVSAASPKQKQATAAHPVAKKTPAALSSLKKTVSVPGASHEANGMSALEKKKPGCAPHKKHGDAADKTAPPPKVDNLVAKLNEAATRSKLGPTRSQIEDTLNSVVALGDLDITQLSNEPTAATILAQPTGPAINTAGKQDMELAASPISPRSTGTVPGSSPPPYTGLTESPVTREETTEDGGQAKKKTVAKPTAQQRKELQAQLREAREQERLEKQRTRSQRLLEEKEQKAAAKLEKARAQERERLAKIEAKRQQRMEAMRLKQEQLQRERAEKASQREKKRTASALTQSSKEQLMQTRRITAPADTLAGTAPVGGRKVIDSGSFSDIENAFTTGGTAAGAENSAEDPELPPPNKTRRTDTGTAVPALQEPVTVGTANKPRYRRPAPLPRNAIAAKVSGTATGTSSSSTTASSAGNNKPSEKSGSGSGAAGSSTAPSSTAQSSPPRKQKDNLDSGIGDIDEDINPVLPGLMTQISNFHQRRSKAKNTNSKTIHSRPNLGQDKESVNRRLAAVQKSVESNITAVQKGTGLKEATVNVPNKSNTPVPELQVPATQVPTTQDSFRPHRRLRSRFVEEDNTDM